MDGLGARIPPRFARGCGGHAFARGCALPGTADSTRVVSLVTNAEKALVTPLVIWSARTGPSIRQTDSVSRVVAHVMGVQCGITVCVVVCLPELVPDKFDDC